jgi:hypothetical protein
MQRHRLARIQPALVPGTAGVPAGLPGLTGIVLPAWGIVRPERPGRTLR